MVRIVLMVALAAGAAVAPKFSDSGAAPQAQPAAAVPQTVVIVSQDVPGDGGEAMMPFGCRWKCLLEGAQAFRQCIEDGGTREECRPIFREVFEACMEDCEPSCEEKCFIAGRQFYRECRKDGGNRRECRKATREFVRKCLADCDGGSPAPDPLFEMELQNPFGGEPEEMIDECRWDCLLKALEAFRACMDDGGSFWECLPVFRKTYEECAENCEVSCEQQCYRDARAFYRECVDNGGNRRECLEEARVMLRGCLDDCDG